jgi:hypothetical protein
MEPALTYLKFPLRPHFRAFLVRMKGANRSTWTSVIGIATLMLLAYCALTCKGQRRKNPRLIMQTRAETRVLADVLHEYWEDFGTYPTIDNKTVVDTLCGENPKQKVYGNRSEFRLNERGEAIDPFGSPYIFSYTGDKVKVTSSAANVSAVEPIDGKP